MAEQFGTRGEDENMRAERLCYGSSGAGSLQNVSGILTRRKGQGIQRGAVDCIITADRATVLIPMADGIDPGSELSSGATTWVTQDKW